jgi:release factor glutamine methyltransferase
MIVKRALRRTAKTLAARSVEDASLEAEVMLMHVLDVDRAGLYLRLDELLSLDSEEALGRVTERRLAQEPLAYITGSREFFGSDLHVAPGVLIPRPETESLIEAAIKLANRRFHAGDPVIADVGTGSGAIAVSLALRLPRARVYATDICPRALEVASVNCRRYDVAVRLLEGDLLDPLPEPVDIVVANLPYVRDDELGGLSAEIRVYEPSIALCGGSDGLDVVRRLIASAAAKLCPGGAVFLEIAPAQVQALTEWVVSNLPGAVVSPFPDLGGVTRFVEAVVPHSAMATIN